MVFLVRDVGDMEKEKENNQYNRVKLKQIQIYQLLQ